MDARVGNSILRARLWLLERRTHALTLWGNLALALIKGRALLLPGAPLDSVKFLTLLPVAKRGRKSADTEVHVLGRHIATIRTPLQRVSGRHPLR